MALVVCPQKFCCSRCWIQFQPFPLICNKGKCHDNLINVALHGYFIGPMMPDHLEMQLGSDTLVSFVCRAPPLLHQPRRSLKTRHWNFPDVEHFLLAYPIHCNNDCTQLFIMLMWRKYHDNKQFLQQPLPPPNDSFIDHSTSCSKVIYKVFHQWSSCSPRCTGIPRGLVSSLEITISWSLYSSSWSRSSQLSACLLRCSKIAPLCFSRCVSLLWIHLSGFRKLQNSF